MSKKFIDIKVDTKEVEDTLKKLEKKTKELEKRKEIPLNELMTNDFVRKHTTHDTFESFAIESGLISKGEEITEEILNSDEFNEYVKNNTSFDSWQNMLENASVEYIQKQLGF